jgi:hypothetical protein
MCGCVRARRVQRPYLQPNYDDPSFIVRSLWRLYCGWWDQHPARLRPPPDADLAVYGIASAVTRGLPDAFGLMMGVGVGRGGREVAALAGGSAAVLRRAQALLEAGRLDLALTFVQYALDGSSSPADTAAAHRLRMAVLHAYEAAEPSLMAKSIYRSFRLASEEALGIRTHTLAPGPSPPKL